MRSAIACTVLFALLAALPAPARAGTSTDVALGLASFAVFNQVVGPLLRGGGHGWGGRHSVVHHHRTIVTQPAVVYATPAPVVYATPAPVVVQAAQVVTTPVVATQVASTVVQYPHGRYELHWTGYQYLWVWIPTAPPPPPPPPAVAPVPPAPPAPPAPAP